MKNATRLRRRGPAESIGHTIREHRLARGLSQRQLAEMAGTTQASIANVESGGHNSTLALLERIATALREDLVLALRRKLGD